MSIKVRANDDGVEESDSTEPRTENDREPKKEKKKKEKKEKGKKRRKKGRRNRKKKRGKRAYAKSTIHEIHGRSDH